MKKLFLTTAVLLAACSQPSSAKIDVELATAAMEVLSADAMQGRRTGTQGNQMARDYLVKQATQLNGGVAPELHSFTYELDRRGEVRTISGTNIIVNIPGKTDGGPVLEITAHYDHLGTRDDEIFNGADDNASGSGALLSILKSLRNTPPEHDVNIVWFDAEELGLGGAGEYVKTRLDDRPRVNMNLDMIAQNKDGIIYMAGAYHTPALKPLIEMAAETVDLDVRFGHDRPEDGANDWTGQSDHRAFHQVGIPFVYYGVEDHPHYHQTSDEFDTIPLNIYRDAVRLAVSTAYILDENLDEIAQSAAQTTPASTEP